jgi:hypothetical protein
MTILNIFWDCLYRYCLMLFLLCAIFKSKEHSRIRIRIFMKTVRNLHPNPKCLKPWIQLIRFRLRLRVIQFYFVTSNGLYLDGRIYLLSHMFRSSWGPKIPWSGTRMILRHWTLSQPAPTSGCSSLISDRNLGQFISHSVVDSNFFFRIQIRKLLFRFQIWVRIGTILRKVFWPELFKNSAYH